MPCVCRVCAMRFDCLPNRRPDVFWALVCEDCGNIICPNCRSHDVYDIVDVTVAVPQRHAASVRASVWGRGH